MVQAVGQDALDGELPVFLNGTGHVIALVEEGAEPVEALLDPGAVAQNPLFHRMPAGPGRG